MSVDIECSIECRGVLCYCSNLSGKTMIFYDRVEAGYFLARYIGDLGFVSRKAIVYGLVAGGVPVAYSLAEKTGLELDIVVVKKITYPWTTEAGFGAVAIDKTCFYDRETAYGYLGLSREDLEKAIDKVHEFVVERTKRLRGSLDYSWLRGYNVIVVDDGVATGYTMLTCIEFLRRQGAIGVYVVSPTGCTSGLELIKDHVDGLFIPNIRSPPYAVADAYMVWYDVSDEEVSGILGEASSKGFYPPKAMREQSLQ